MKFAAYRTVIAGLAAALLLLTGNSAAYADSDTPDLISGGKPPAGWSIDADAYSSAFGPLNQGAPQGTLIADSGFRPYPNGFPIENWGTAQDFIDSQLIFGIPQRSTVEEYFQDSIAAPAELNALALRRTFGDGVCREPDKIDKRTGDCQLIFGAELLAQLIETGALGGHCFGMATAAAALYNGQLPASQVGASGVGINIANPMRQPAVQTITRLYGTQYFNDSVRSILNGEQKPTDVVNALIADLPGGTVPYNLVVLGPEGGHAVTPYAVLDRGEGLFDIAVYDNNFPLRSRAVTINTTANSFTYSSSINPSAPGIEWNSSNGSIIGLVSVADLLTEQSCPVCLSPIDQGTLVTVSPINADNDDEFGFRLVDEGGAPLDSSLFRVLAPLNPPTEQQITQPAISVQPGVRFGIVMSTGNLASKQSLEVYAIAQGEAQYLLLDELVSNSTTIFGVGREEGILFESSEPSSPRILQLSDQPGVSLDVNGHPLDLPAGVTVDQWWNTAAQRVEYRSNASTELRWNIQIGGLDNTGGSEYVGLNVPVPAGGVIVVDYSDASQKRAPRAWIRTADGQRQAVTLQPVTKQLINAYRDRIYVAGAPS